MPLNPAAEDVLGRLGNPFCLFQEGAGDKALEARPGGAPPGASDPSSRGSGPAGRQEAPRGEEVRGHRGAGLLRGPGAVERKGKESGQVIFGRDMDFTSWDGRDAKAWTSFLALSS